MCMCIYILHMCTYLVWCHRVYSSLFLCEQENTPHNIIALGSRTWKGLPDGTSGKEPACQWRRKKHRFDPWVGKISWRRAWRPTPVFLPGEAHGQTEPGSSPGGRKELDTTEATKHASTRRPHAALGNLLCCGVGGTLRVNVSICLTRLPAWVSLSGALLSLLPKPHSCSPLPSGPQKKRLKPGPLTVTFHPRLSSPELGSCLPSGGQLSCCLFPVGRCLGVSSFLFCFLVGEEQNIQVVVGKIALLCVASSTCCNS